LIPVLGEVKEPSELSYPRSSDIRDPEAPSGECDEASSMIPVQPGRFGKGNGHTACRPEHIEVLRIAKII
jgi:hypothetical protein